MYWHVHGPVIPWCIAYDTERMARQVAEQPSATVPLLVIVSDYPASECPYRAAMKYGNAVVKDNPKMTSPAMVRMPDGSDMSGSDLTCEGCGSDLAGHACAGAAGTSAPTVVHTRSTGPRKPKADREPCAHCGGALHFNMGATAVNAECMVRQYALDNGLMTDPNGRLPVLTLEMMGQINDWGSKLSTPLTYGKMESSAGGAATYSGMRPKTGRKKKAVAAAPGAQIQDIANEEASNIEAPAEKPKRVRKPKVVATTTSPDDTDSEAYNPNEVLATYDAPVEGATINPEPLAVIEEAEAVAASADDAETARAERAAKRAARKALLAGK